ncbi:MAG: glycosyltransferase family 2 protein [Bacteroidota bacterium]
MSKVTLSIITVTYNAEKYIQPTIESVVNQSFKGFEYLIIDGASNDSTLKIIDRYKSKIDQVVSEKDDGVYHAMNKGLELARGKYVLFLNAGDELSGETILENIFNIDTDADIIYGETNILNQDRKVIGTRSELTSRKLPEQLVKKDFLKGQIVSHQSFIAKRDLCPPYNTHYKCSADIDWMLQVISKSGRVKNVNQSISNYLQGGISDRQLGRCWKERFFILLKYFRFVDVMISHIRFFFRFFQWGRYRS